MVDSCGHVTAGSAESARKIRALDSQTQRLVNTFACAGYEQVAPAVIQPADLFLHVVGEAPIRGEDHGALFVAGIDELQ